MPRTFFEVAIVIFLGFLTFATTAWIGVNFVNGINLSIGEGLPRSILEMGRMIDGIGQGVAHIHMRDIAYLPA
jgi:hypothetical protein